MKTGRRTSTRDFFPRVLNVCVSPRVLISTDIVVGGVDEHRHAFLFFSKCASVRMCMCMVVFSPCDMFRAFFPRIFVGTGMLVCCRHRFFVAASDPARPLYFRSCVLVVVRSAGILPCHGISFFLLVFFVYVFFRGCPFFHRPPRRRRTNPTFAVGKPEKAVCEEARLT